MAAEFFLGGLARHRDHALRNEEEHPKEAVRMLTAARHQQEDHYGAQYLLAVCRIHEKLWQDARNLLTGCLNRRPEFHWPLLLRGFAAMQMRDYAAAEADFNAILDVMRNDKQA